MQIYDSRLAVPLSRAQVLIKNLPINYFKEITTRIVASLTDYAKHKGHAPRPPAEEDTPPPFADKCNYCQAFAMQSFSN